MSIFGRKKKGGVKTPPVQTNLNGSKPEEDLFDGLFTEPLASKGDAAQGGPPKMAAQNPGLPSGPRPLTSPKGQQSTSGPAPMSAQPPGPVIGRRQVVERVVETPAVNQLEIDYDKLAEMIVRKITDSNLASKIASRVPLPANEMAMSENDMQTLANKFQSLMLESLSIQVMEGGKQTAVPLTEFVGAMRQQLDRLERKQRGIITFKWWELVLLSVFIGVSLGATVTIIVAMAIR